MTNLPAVVYKYFNWNDTESRKILTERELYFCNAKKWGNYGEYAFTFKPIDKAKAYDNLNREIYKLRNTDPLLFEKWFNIHIHIYKIDVGNYATLSKVDRDQWETNMVDEIIRHRIKEMMNNIPQYETSTKGFYYKHTGIFSTSLVNDSVPLWNWKKTFNCQTNGNAVCIGLDLAKIKEKLDAVGNYSIGLVNYQGEHNKVEFVGSTADFLINRLNSITFTLTKDAVPNISDQKELRIMKFLTGRTSLKAPERFLKLDDTCITEIIVHDTATNAAKNEIEAIALKIGCTNIAATSL